MLLLLKILSSIVLTGIGVGFVLACLAAAWFNLSLQRSTKGLIGLIGLHEICFPSESPFENGNLE